MSLDFYLESDVATKKTCFHCNSEYEHREELFSINITHNLGKMAARAGIYNALWRPEENDYKTAADIIPDLKEGLRLLKKYPDFFREFNAENGWGTYKNFVPFVEEVLKNCEENPTALIQTSR